MFYVGQRVVCIKDHSLRFIKKGDTFTVLDINSCSCGDIHLLVLTTNHPAYRCGICNIIHEKGDWYASSQLFAPLDEQPELSETTSENWIERLLPEPELV